MIRRTGSEWESWMWQTGRQVAARGRQGGPAQPRGSGPRLDICSGVKWRLARPANLSCHSSWWRRTLTCHAVLSPGGWAATRIGQRSRFIFCLGRIQTEPLARTSICHSTCLCCTCLAPAFALYCHKSIQQRACFFSFLLFFLYTFVVLYSCFKLRAVMFWGGGRSMLCSDCRSPLQHFHYVQKRAVLTHPAVVLFVFNWWQRQTLENME